MTPRADLELHVEPDPEPRRPATFRRQPAARSITPEFVAWLRDVGASDDLVGFAEKHIDKPRRSGCLSVLPWLALILVWVLW